MTIGFFVFYTDYIITVTMAPAKTLVTKDKNIKKYIVNCYRCFNTSVDLPRGGLIVLVKNLSVYSYLNLSINKFSAR